ncbi:uncharacterized protein Dvir_GJ25715 [Drosophila virilis]|uniref:Uncharacterized protein n=1 Tax=Drosophila virilis TaxID=7244 RepID=A0A0Q9W304_DROVI|nr:uncharacterized protein Dvir_GJ25715 [Drosophila virilis]
MDACLLGRAVDGWIAVLQLIGWELGPGLAVCLANCINAKTTAAFANLHHQQKKKKQTLVLQQQRLHNCICIYVSIRWLRALYCRYVLDGPAKWRNKKRMNEKTKARAKNDFFPCGKTNHKCSLISIKEFY